MLYKCNINPYGRHQWTWRYYARRMAWQRRNCQDELTAGGSDGNGYKPRKSKRKLIK